MPPRSRRQSGLRCAATLTTALAVAVAGCAGPSRRAGRPAATARRDSKGGHLPDFVARAYAPFSRSAAVAIALHEWKLWGGGVDDDPPGTRPPPLPEDKPERQAGYWQRVGEYWFLGQPEGAREAAWTGKHDSAGAVFDADSDADYAWSAAFVSYVMRIAGAGDRFPYSPAHHVYIDAAREVSLAKGAAVPGWAVSAEPPSGAAPLPGDLICTSRTRVPVRFEDLPAGVFAAHCDIVVAVTPAAPQAGALGTLAVVGGNVDDAVTMKHVPVGRDGALAPAGAPPYDDRYPWFVVLRVLYAAP